MVLNKIKHGLYRRFPWIVIHATIAITIALNELPVSHLQMQSYPGHCNPVLTNRKVCVHSLLTPLCLQWSYFHVDITVFSALPTLIYYLHSLSGIVYFNMITISKALNLNVKKSFIRRWFTQILFGWWFFTVLFQYIVTTYFASKLYFIPGRQNLPYRKFSSVSFPHLLSSRPLPLSLIHI